MAPTPSSSKSNNSTPKQNPSHHQPRTPQSKHRLTFPKETAAAAADHPVEVIGRIRDHPEQKNRPNANPSSALQINGDGKSLRLKTEIGYRDFTLDGVSQSENDDLDGFYKKFVESRINGVKLGQKCTIMMYGPTGSGKSHTMFGCPNQPGIVYNSLRGILGECVGEEDVGKLGFGTFVQVTVLEIYNEEIYDLLPSANNGGGFSLGWAKGGSASKVKLEVMGKKAKNATFISGNEAGKILREIQKVEKRRIVKSTLCNERSSRSHCMIIVDVPTVGGRLMLVDMAGSENIEQAGQIGLEAKLQTAKINQGNIALKRVVESIANGDSHVPFRDSKLTMLLQDSFEDDKSKILMILCASPDPKELHKTIATLEYGAKAKCIVRGPITPNKAADQDSSSAVILGSRIEALDQFICKLQIENKLREKEKNEAEKELRRKEQEVSLLRSKLAVVGASEEEINSKVNERTKMLRTELERKILECQKTASEFVEMEKRKMEERMLQQQKEVEMLRRRLEDMESELRVSRAGSSSLEIDGGNFVRRLMEVSSSDQESDMVKSMDLDKSYDFETTNVFHPCPSRALLTTVYEEEEHENDEVQKEVIEEKKMIVTPQVLIQNLETRQLRIQNIFNLCGNYREVPQHSSTPMPAAIKRVNDNKEDSASITMLDETSRFQKSSISNDLLLTEHLKENRSPLLDGSASDDIEVYVKWEEASKGNHGKFISRFKVSKDSTLADLRKLIEIHLGGDHPQTFTFLVLGDPSGAPVAKENEASTPTSKLPICNSQSRVRLACLRSVKSAQWSSREPFSNLENKMVASSHFFTKKGDDGCFFSTEIAQQNLCPNNNSTPFL